MSTYLNKDTTQNNQKEQNINIDRTLNSNLPSSHQPNSSHSTPNSSHNSPNSSHNSLNPSCTTLNIIHFNDVYNIDGRRQEPVGGAARFVTAVNQLKHLNPLILFSGDIFNPSSIGVVTKGEQMVDVMNSIDVHYSLYGNHDFDFGVDRLAELTEKTNCKWLMSNAVDVSSGGVLGGGIISEVVEWGGVKVGLMGLIEKDWVDCLGTVDPEDVEVLDFVEEGRSIAEELRQQGADVVIALSHMRWPNDIHLATEVDQIDLVLGGHDHDFTFKQLENGGRILKSGTDFREFGHVTMTFEDLKLKDVKVKRVEVNSEVMEDVAVKEIVEKYTHALREKMEVVIGRMDVSMDGTFATVRTRESNLGNFVTDIMLKSTNAHLAILNAGTLRSDVIHPKGDFRVRDLTNILPMHDAVVLLRMNGNHVLEALENAVSKYPSMEGRFAQVSGMTFGFDPTKKPGSRVRACDVRVQGSNLVLDQFYNVATKAYMAEGKDGYDVFKKAQVLIDEENGQPLVTVVRNHFESVCMSKGEMAQKSGHKQSLISLNKRKLLTDSLTHDAAGDFISNSIAHLKTTLPSTTAPPIDSPPANTPSMTSSTANTAPRNATSSPLSHALRRQTCVLQKSKSCLQRRQSISVVEATELSRALAPVVEGRIWILSATQSSDPSPHASLLACKINEEAE